jgi:hypothetical protein
LKQKRIQLAIQNFVVAKLEKDKQTTLASIGQYIDYVNEILNEYASFVEVQENLILFGGETDLKDIKR